MIMKYTLLFFISILFFACSENENPGEPEEPLLMKKFDISASDTAGLRIFGIASIYKNDSIPLALLGNKNGYLWIQFLKDSPGNNEQTCKKVSIFTSNVKFNDTRIYDLGYGENVTFRVRYVDINEDFSLNPIDMYFINLHNFEHFSLSGGDGNVNRILSWIINKNEILESKAYYSNVISNGYIGYFPDGIGFQVCNEKGEALYPYKDDFKDYVFINLYEYIKLSATEIVKENAETGQIIWKHGLGKLGQTIDGHEPKIEYTVTIAKNMISFTFKITNYDATKEEKTIKLDITSGESIN